MAEGQVRYETRTVKCVRGMESRTAARWELVSQTSGRLQSELLLRRPARKVPRRALVIGGGVAAALAVVIVLGATGVFGDEPKDQVATTSTSPSATAPSSSTSSSTTPSSTASADAGAAGATAVDSVLTPANSPELAALLQLGDHCDPSIAAFAEANASRTVASDGSIGRMDPHERASSRYNILLSPGDFSTTTTRGPSFQYRDVNTTYDLHYEGAVPDMIGAGTNLAITATVEEYNPTQCLFQLKPVTTMVR